MEAKRISRIITIGRNILISSLLIGACIFAGRSDYQDAVLSEMKNNGAYYKLSELHPDASEAELIDLYEEQN